VTKEVVGVFALFSCALLVNRKGLLTGKFHFDGTNAAVARK
jgi:hypothetical protein